MLRQPSLPVHDRTILAPSAMKVMALPGERKAQVGPTHWAENPILNPLRSFMAEAPRYQMPF